MTRELCNVRTCPAPSRVRGLCKHHYYRYVVRRSEPPPGLVIGPPRPEFTGPYCDCAMPQWRSVTLWGTITLTDVIECTDCSRPPRP